MVDTTDFPNELVRKDNSLIRTKVKIDSVDAGRILATLIACVDAADTGFKDKYTIAAKTFLTDSSGTGYTRIKQLCRQLVQATAEVEKTDPKSNEPTFIACPFFMRIEYAKGVITASFNPLMSSYLLELKKCFTQYNLYEYLKLPSIYSQRVFEILSSWSNLPDVTIHISKLHEMLNVPQSFRKDFRQFRIYILEKAHEDINTKTSLCYEWEAIKSGRSVDKIRFIFPKHVKAISQNSNNNQTDMREQDFEKFMEVYPRKENIAKANLVWCDLIKQGKLPSMDVLLTALEYFTIHSWQDTESRFIPYAVTWLANERWQEKDVSEYCKNNSPERKAEKAADEAKRKNQQEKQENIEKLKKEQKDIEFNEFISKFSNCTTVDLLRIVWGIMESASTAPLATDVPCDFQDTPQKFVLDWIKTYNIKLPSMMVRSLEKECQSLSTNR